MKSAGVCLSMLAHAHVCEYVLGLFWASRGKFSNSEINDLKPLVCCDFQLSGFPSKPALGSVCGLCMANRYTVDPAIPHG